MPSRRLFAHRPTATPAPPTWPSYTGTSQYVGVTPDGRVTVYVDPSLGAGGLQSAQALLQDAPRILDANDAFFGTPSGAVRVIVFALSGATDGTGGADHMACNFQTGGDIEVDVALGQPARVSALFEAELSECSMNGNLCGESTGEALSRWCAAAVSQNALTDFATAPGWDQAGRPNWVDVTEETDQGFESIGCGMAFLSYLQSLGFSLATISQALVALGTGSTLAHCYAQLTGQAPTEAWPRFLAALDALPGGVQDDDPFGALATPVPPPTPPPVPPPPPPPPPPPSPCEPAMLDALRSAVEGFRPVLRDLIATELRAQRRH